MYQQLLVCTPVENINTITMLRQLGYSVTHVTSKYGVLEYFEDLYFEICANGAEPTLPFFVLDDKIEDGMYAVKCVLENFPDLNTVLIQSEKGGRTSSRFDPIFHFALTAAVIDAKLKTLPVQLQA